MESKMESKSNMKGSKAESQHREPSRPAQACGCERSSASKSGSAPSSGGTKKK